MTVTDLQLKRLRTDLSLDDASWNDTVLTDFYTRAGEEGVTLAAAVEPYVRLMIIRQLWLSSTRSPDIQVNQVNIKRSQTTSGLKSLYEIYESAYQRVIGNDAGGAIHFGGVRTVPTHVGEYPNEDIPL